MQLEKGELVYLSSGAEALLVKIDALAADTNSPTVTTNTP